MVLSGFKDEDFSAGILFGSTTVAETAAHPSHKRTFLSRKSFSNFFDWFFWVLPFFKADLKAAQASCEAESFKKCGSGISVNVLFEYLEPALQYDAWVFLRCCCFVERAPRGVPLRVRSVRVRHAYAEDPTQYESDRSRYAHWVFPLQSIQCLVGYLLTFTRSVVCFSLLSYASSG